MARSWTRLPSCGLSRADLWRRWSAGRGHGPHRRRGSRRRFLRVYVCLPLLDDCVLVSATMQPTALSKPMEVFPTSAHTAVYTPNVPEDTIDEGQERVEGLPTAEKNKNFSIGSQRDEGFEFTRAQDAKDVQSFSSSTTLIINLPGGSESTRRRLPSRRTW